MSGLLSRLASRAAGSAPVLRADAGLAGFSGSGGHSGEDVGEGIFSRAGMAYPSTETVAPPVAATVPASAAKPLPTAPRPVPSAASRAAPPVAQEAMPGTGPEVAPPAFRHDAGQDARPDVRPDAWPNAITETPALVVPASTPSRMPLPNPSSPLSPVAQVPLVQPPLRTGSLADMVEMEAAPQPNRGAAGDMSVAPVDSAGRVPAPRAHAGAEPAPLMAQGPHPAPLAAPPPRARVPSPGAAAQTAGSDTEVHIHIGRIDVTAMPEAPAPRRNEPKVQPPLSLDAYLAQRGRS